ncbi:MAG: TolC family protein [Planctomycetota bacterium]
MSPRRFLRNRRSSRRSAALPLLLGSLGLGLASAEDPPPAPQAEHPLLLSLADALAIAVQNNLELEIEGIATEIAQLDALGSWGAFDPTLSVQGSITDQERPATSDFSGADVLEENTQALNTSLVFPFRTGGNVSLAWDRSNYQTNNRFASFDTSTTDTVTAMVTQPLLRGAWERFATTTQREAESVLRRQVEREREVRNKLLRGVYDAYWNLVSAREELGVREIALGLGERWLEQETRKLEVGTGTEIDVLQAETNVAQQKELRIQAEFDRRAAEDALRRLLFQKPAGDVEAFLADWDGTIEPITLLPEVDATSVGGLEWRRALEAAIANRPELAQSRLDVDAAEIHLERSRSDRRPQLDLELRATGVGFDTDPADAFQSAGSFEFPEYAGSLVFSLPLRNRTARNAERAARAAVRNARLAYDVLELDILAEVRGAVRDVRYRSESVTAAKTSLALARRQLEAEEARFRHGVSTTYQVLEFQKDLAEALSNEQAARAAYAKALAALRHAEGGLAGPPRSMAAGGAGGETTRAGQGGE